MTMQELKIFEEKQIRTVWDEVQEKWYFCINDIIEALTDSKAPADYFKKIRKRDAELDVFVRGTICPPHQFIAADGKRHSAKCMDLQSILRLVQSIPSKKAEPFKRWLAQIGAERVHQMQDPELGIRQSLMDYKRLGYSDNWINQRLKSIEIRKELTDQWRAHNVQEGVGYATLTNEELVMNMLAELTATNITKEEHPQTMGEHAQVAARGGSVARVAKEAFEEQTGKKVVTSLNMKTFLESQNPELGLDEEQ